MKWISQSIKAGINKRREQINTEKQSKKITEHNYSYNKHKTPNSAIVSDYYMRNTYLLFTNLQGWVGKRRVPVVSLLALASQGDRQTVPMNIICQSDSRAKQ